MRTEVTPRPKALLTVVREAIAWAREAGITVRIGDYGVRCTSVHARDRWEYSSPNGVDPLGAAILQHQPANPHLPDAAAQALGCSIAWTEGFCAGLAKEASANNWGAQAHRFVSGYEAGSIIRGELLRHRNYGCASAGGRLH